MGVQGLWDILAPTGKSHSLANLAMVEGFDSNKSGKRAYRVGVDASIWYKHAAYSKGGDNPDLRLLFFRLSSFAKLPILPLFVFDGRNRPKVKRGSRMGKSGSHNLNDGMKTLLDVFGMEWRMADGEAEADLAYLNRIGVIDAILTDDVDALVFGALTIIRNPSVTLSGNKAKPALNTEGKASKHHVMVYTAESIRSHPQVKLTRGGLILFALLAGGDYDSGVEKFGKGIAFGLARCGFGDQLLTAFERRGQQDMRTFLKQWHADINAELRTNSRGYLQHKHPSLSLPATFPNMTVLGNYAAPAFRSEGGAIRDTGDLSLPQIAGLCEIKFTEWGHKSAIIKRFRDLLWEAAVIRILRRAAIEADRKEVERRVDAGEDYSLVRGPIRPSRVDAVGTPSSLVKKYLSKAEVNRIASAFVNRGPPQFHRADSDAPDTHPLILRVVGTRRHISTDRMLEYRVEVGPTQLVDLVLSGIRGIHREPLHMDVHADDDFEDLTGLSRKSTKSPKKPPPDPKSTMRMWIPASMMCQVHPGLVEDFEDEDEAKKPKAGGGKGKGKRRAVDDDSDIEMERSPVKPRPKPKRKVKKKNSDVGLSSSQSNTDMSGYSSPRGSSLDPWFSMGDGNGQSGRGFLFSFPNPDDTAIPDTEDPHELDDDDEEMDQPRDHFDFLFEQIMGLSEKTSNRQKNAISRRKRSRLIAADCEGAHHEDLHGRARKKRKNMTCLPSSVAHSQPEWCSYPLPSSSQESGLVHEDAEDVIDLT